MTDQTTATTEQQPADKVTKLEGFVKASGLSQRAFALSVDMDHSLLGKILNRQKPITDKTAARLKEAGYDLEAQA